MAEISDDRNAAMQLAKRLLAGKGVPEGFAAGGEAWGDPTQAGVTFRDVKTKPYMTPAQNRAYAQDTAMGGVNRLSNSRVEEVPIRRLYATQATVNPDFATTESSAGELPHVIRLNGEMYVMDGHHRITKAARNGAQTVRVRLHDFDNPEGAKTPLLDYDPEKRAKMQKEDEELLAELLGEHKAHGGKVGMGKIIERARQRRSLGGRLALERAAKARKEAGPPAPTGSSYMPGVPRQVAARGGEILYSHAAKVAEELPQDSGTVEQMLAMLKKRGVKPSEMDNAGRPDGEKVTKGALAEHFRNKMPNILHRKEDEYGNEGDDLRRYAEYTAPGDQKNYREHLLELKRPPDPEFGKLNSRRSQIPFEMGAAIRENRQDDHDRLRAEYKDVLDGMDRSRARSKAMQVEDYRSSHWPEDRNIVAHFRTTDRAAPDGGRALNVEEVQSDWGQEGRKGGFRPAGSRADAVMADEDLRKRYTDAGNAQHEAERARADASRNVWETWERLSRQGEDDPDSHPDYLKAEEEFGKAAAHHDNMLEAYRKTDKEYADSDFHDAINDKRPPTAPYVTNTGGWVDLALKHIFHEAVKGGYDHVSFNPGAANAKMFGLDKQVDDISYDPPNKLLAYTMKGRSTRTPHPDKVEPDQLPNVIGKELSEKLLASQHPRVQGIHYLEGDDLQVASPGMRDFYDNIVPKAALKLARQHDPDIQPGTGPTGGFSLPVTSALSEGITQRGFPAFKDGGAVNQDLFDYSRLDEVPNVEQAELPRYEPPRGVSQRTLDVTGNKDVRDKMHEVLDAGEKLGGRRWYNADPLHDKFKEVLGSGGPKAFRKFMDLVAATSPRSKVGENVRNASYYYHRIMTGKGVPEVGDKNPSPYGHMAQRLHQMNAKAVAGPGWDPLKNPKPASFVENLSGNQLPGTIDTHAFRLPAMIAKDPRFLATDYQTSKDAPKRNLMKEVERGDLDVNDAPAAGWQSVPKDNEYRHLEHYYRGLGKERGMTTAQTQAAAWVGGGALTGLASDESKPFLRFLEDRIRLTAHKHGMEPNDVLHKFIKGEIPLLSTGGRVGRAAGGAIPSGHPGIKMRAIRGPNGEKVLHVDKIEPPGAKAAPSKPEPVTNHWSALALGRVLGR